MSSPNLIKGIGLFGAVTLVMGSMIGSGIFIAPSIMAGFIPSPGVLLGLWVVGGIFTMFGALSVGELAAAFPRAGGTYIFLKEAFSPLFGFLYGWTLFLVIQTGFIAAVAMAFAKYAGVFWPAISENNHFAHFNTAQIVAIASIWVLTAINYRGVKEGAFVQNLFTVLKVAAILILVAAGFFLHKGSLQNFHPFLGIPKSQIMTTAFAAALAVSLSKALFAYDAWNTVTFAAEEVQNPQKNLPLALVLGTLGVTLLYTLATAFYIYIVPIAEMPGIADNRIAAEAAFRVLGPTGLLFISAAILISTFGCNNGLILGGARVYYAMAKDGLFFKKVQRLHPRFVTPTTALIYQAIWASLLTLTGTYSDLLTYTSFASVLFSILTVAGLFVLRKKAAHIERPVKCPGYPFVPLLYILIGLAFTFYIVQGDARNSMMGLVLILTGIPAYFFWARRKI